ncbi:unnamed protein product [Rotaria magnacalcarata]|uniref:Uncharacterized protein n=1 Tax=Rotaria magnacalcarata TaxID=392030 RepID=A0A819RTF2_9BILA|nr:unnamed protein product [Rotaria magnacalcarata]CAF4045748.1 unnamed protein product [Rotaria magnacalcarata]
MFLLRLILNKQCLMYKIIINLTFEYLEIDSSLKKNSNSIDINDLSSSSNHIRSYQIGSLFTSASTFIMHQNEVIAQTTATDHFLSDTIFIILIAILTIIILLFCLGLFCLCRQTSKRNISPSFDAASYVGLNEHSLEIPIGNYQQQTSKYENDIPYINDVLSSANQKKSSINHPTMINDRISLQQTIDLHNTRKQKTKTNNKKLKKKRIGCCCCSSSDSKKNSVKKNLMNEIE